MYRICTEEDTLQFTVTEIIIQIAAQTVICVSATNRNRRETAQFAQVLSRPFPPRASTPYPTMTIRQSIRNLNYFSKI